MIELAGAPAIASTSAGVAWVHGRPDGQKPGREEMVEAIRRMVRAVTVPVTADIEGGYGSGSVSTSRLEPIACSCRAIDGPLNIMAGPGAPTTKQLGQLGVARVSVGPAITQAALGITQRAARELLERGTYGELGDAMLFGEANSMFVP